MKSLKDNLYNDLWNWIDSVSIKYKNYEIKKAIIHNKGIQCTQIMENIYHFNLIKILSSIKWKLKLNLSLNKVQDQNLFSKIRYNSTYSLCNKNLYTINISPDDRGFTHISALAKNDNRSLVITVKNDVYCYFNKLKIPVIFLDVLNPWKKINDLKIDIPLVPSEKKFLLSLDLLSIISLLRAASLIDLLDILINEKNLPKALITQQDFSTFDSVFASYFLGKIPTVTLQHGLIGRENLLWKYVTSDRIIVWSLHQAEILESLGVIPKKIKVLGTAKYDLYADNKIKSKLENNKNKRVLLGIQQTMFYKKYSELIFNFIKDLLISKGNYLISIKFHPAITKKNQKKFVQKLKKLNLNYGVKINISDIEDSLEDIFESDIILVSYSGLAVEAMLLKKPVIEYLSKNENMIKFGDYRDFSLHASTGEEAKKLIFKLLNNDIFYKKIIEKQNKSINKEIMLPPAIPRILDFINSLNNDKRSVKNNQ